MPHRTSPASVRRQRKGENMGSHLYCVLFLFFVFFRKEQMRQGLGLSRLTTSVGSGT